MHSIPWCQGLDLNPMQAPCAPGTAVRVWEIRGQGLGPVLALPKHVLASKG